MWLYVQTWYPTLTIALTAAICFSVASFTMGRTKRHPSADRSLIASGLRKPPDEPA
jgi:hypothetical protein